MAEYIRDPDPMMWCLPRFALALVAHIDREWRDGKTISSKLYINISTISIYAPSWNNYIYKAKTNRAKGEINSSTVITGDYDTPFPAVDRPSRQRIREGADGLNNAIREMGLIEMCRTFYSTKAEYIFSSAHGTFSRINHMLDHGTSLSNFKKWNRHKYRLWPQCYEGRNQW